MAHHRHLPIWKAALSLAVHLEQAVRRFARYHKYTLGQDLRLGAQVARAGAGRFQAALLMHVDRCWMLPGRTWSTLPGGHSTQRPGLGPCTEWPLQALPALRSALQRQGMAYAVAAQTGHYTTGFKRRTLVAWWAPLIPPAPQPSSKSNLGD